MKSWGGWGSPQATGALYLSHLTLIKLQTALSLDYVAQLRRQPHRLCECAAIHAGHVWVAQPVWRQSKHQRRKPKTTMQPAMLTMQSSVAHRVQAVPVP